MYINPIVCIEAILMYVHQIGLGYEIKLGRIRDAHVLTYRCAVIGTAKISLGG